MVTRPWWYSIVRNWQLRMFIETGQWSAPHVAVATPPERRHRAPAVRER